MYDTDSRFIWAGMAPIVTRGITPSEPHIPFLELSSMWTSKELQPVTEFKANLKDVCLSVLSYSQVHFSTLRLTLCLFMEETCVNVFTQGWLFCKEAPEKNKQNDESTNTTG